MKSKLHSVHSGMKSKAIALVCALAVGLAGTGRCLGKDPDPGYIVVDTMLVRPFCLAATVVGSAFFVLSLPFAVPSKTVHRTAHALVAEPARMTFSRPLGDLDDLNFQ